MQAPDPSTPPGRSVLARLVSSPDPTTAARRRAIAWPTALALLVRLLYFAENARSPFFALPILDEQFYDQAARALLAGDAAALGGGFRPLAYPAFLAVFYGLFGDLGPSIALAAQHLLGAATAGLVAWTILRLGAPPRAAAVGGCLYALASPPLYFEGQLLATSLAAALAAAWLTIASGLAPARSHRGLWIALGATTALLVQVRPNAIFLAAAAAVVACLMPPTRPPSTHSPSSGSLRESLAPRVLPFGLFAASLVAGLAVAGGIQAGLVDGSFRLLPSAGGVNLYLGNERGADGLRPLQDRHTSSGDRYVDSVALFAAAEERAAGVEPGDGTAYWLGRTAREIADDPGAWFGLMGRKLVYLAWNREVPNNRSFAFAATHESRILAAAPVRWWLLVALAGVALVVAPKTARRSWPIAFLVAWGAGVVLFFVAGRYRLPMWPAMAVLAGLGAERTLDLARRAVARDADSLRRLTLAAAVAGGLATLSLVDWTGVGPESWFRDYVYRSMAWQQRGDLERAVRDAEIAVNLHLDDPTARFQVGTLYMEQGRLDEALTHLEIARTLEPTEPRSFHNLGLVHERLGDPGKAYLAFRRAVELSADYSPPRVSLALLELRRGRSNEAERLIDEARALGNPSVDLLVARALFATSQGREDDARRLLDEARRLDADGLRAVLERQGLMAPRESR